MFLQNPVVLLCGDGGSGKDEVAKHLAVRWKLPYTCSTSYVAAQKMWPQVQAGLFYPSVRHAKVLKCPFPEMEHCDLLPDFDSLEHFYAQRIHHRRFWSDWIDYYNKASRSKAQLYIDAVQAGNHILTGIRKVQELDAFLATGVPDLAIWIERPGVPRDPTQEYGKERCDLVLCNDGDVAALHKRIDRITNFLNGMYWREQ